MVSRLLALFARRGGLPLADYDGLYFIDDFSNGPTAAGSVHGTASSDGLAKRYLLDTGSYLSISTKLDCANVHAISDPVIRYRTAADGSWAFAQDDAYIFSINPEGTGYPIGTYRFGYETNLSGTAIDPAYDCSISNIRADCYPGESAIAHNVDLGLGSSDPTDTYDDTIKTSRMVFKVADGGGFLLLKYKGGTRWKVEYASTIAHGGTAAFPVWSAQSTTNKFTGCVNLIAAAAMGTAWAGSPAEMTTPSALDTATMPSADCFITLKNITVPSAGAIQIEFRKSGSDELMVEIDSTGKPTIYENGVARIEGSAAQVTNGEYLHLEFDGALARMWTHDAQNPVVYQTLALTGGTGINVASLGTAGAVGLVQAWQSYHDAPFVMP